MSDAFNKYQNAGLQHHNAQIGIERTEPSFEQELTSLLNRHSMESDSSTPDFILAAYMHGCLRLFNTTIQQRANWRDEPLDKIFRVHYDDKVKVVVQNGDGKGEDIGEAQLEIFPGKTMQYGKIVGVRALFDRSAADE